jgi:hypothetical protein
LMRKVQSTGNLQQKVMDGSETDSLLEELQLLLLASTSVEKEDESLEHTPMLLTPNLSQFLLRESNSSCSGCHSREYGGDDADSVNSMAYFEPTDFDVSTWKTINDASAVGAIFVVALATALTHPILFFAGAVTAWTTATAAQKGYHYYYNNNNNIEGDEHHKNSDNWFCWDGSFWGSQSEEPASSALSSPDVMISVPNKHEQQKEEQRAISSSAPDPAASASAVAEDDATAECSHSTEEELEEVEVTDKDTTHSSRETATATLTTPNKKKLVKLLIDEEDAWIQANYPPFNHTVLEHAGPLVGLNASELFQVFFADDAPYSFQVFQEKRGDKDIHYGRWQDLPQQGSLTLVPSSPACASLPTFPSNLSVRSWQGRRLSFRAKTNNFLGPAFASTVKTQRLLIVNKRLSVLESRTDLADIPFADRFFVLERWIVRASKHNDRYVANVTVSCQVVFTQNCALEQQIRSKSVSAIADIVTAWCQMATEALQVTEQNKLQRLQHNHHHFTGHSGGSEDTTAEDDTTITTYEQENEKNRATPSNQSKKQSPSVETEGVEILFDPSRFQAALPSSTEPIVPHRKSSWGAYIRRRSLTSLNNRQSSRRRANSWEDDRSKYSI